MLATAAALEWLIANTHGVAVASIHQHTIVPGMVHVVAIMSIPVSLFPVLRSKPAVPFWVRYAGALGVSVLLLAGLTLAAAFLASTLSAAVLAWHRRHTYR